MANVTRLKARRLEPPSAATILWTSMVCFWRDNVLGMAGMVAFFAFLAIIPILILLLAFVGNVLAGQVSSKEVENLFHNAIPGLTQHQFLRTYWEPVKQSRVATRVLGVVTLVLGTTGLHDAVDWAVNRIWRAPHSRPFWQSKLRGLAVILWVIAFVVLSLLLAWLWAPVLTHSATSVLLSWVGLIPSLILDIAIFAALYKLTPTVWVAPRHALAAGAVAATLWEASKLVFGWWVLEVSTYNSVYGPLAASIIVMLWLWISAAIFLFGAELNAVLQQRRYLDRERDLAAAPHHH